MIQAGPSSHHALVAFQTLSLSKLITLKSLLVCSDSLSQLPLWVSPAKKALLWVLLMVFASKCAMYCLRYSIFCWKVQCYTNHSSMILLAKGQLE